MSTMVFRLISLSLVFLLFFSDVKAQEEEAKTYDHGFLFGVSNGSRGWGGSLTYVFGSNPSQYVISLDLNYIKDSHEALTSPFIGEQGKRYIFGKINNFWNLSPMFGIYHNAIPRGNNNVVKFRVGAKVGPALGILNPYHIELYQATGNPFAPEIVIAPYDPVEHSYGEIVGRAGIWSSEFNPTLQMGLSTHVNAFVDFSRTDAAVRGIELGMNADMFFKEVPILAEINGVQNRRLFISVFAGLIFGGKW